MANFHFQARDKTGKEVSGDFEAEHAEAVAGHLIQQQLTPVMIVERKAKSAGFSLSDLMRLDIFSGKVKIDEMIMFCRQMHSLLKAGVPILLAVNRLAETTRQRTFREVLKQVASDVSSGRSFSGSIAKYPKIFSKMFVSIMRAGEASGKLDEAFMQLAKYQILEASAKKRLGAAMRYPTMVFFAVMIGILVINFMVVPAFSELFSQFKSQLPLPTKVLIAISNFMVNHWLLLFIIAATVIAGIRYYVATDNGRYFWHWFKLKIPIFGSIAHRVLTARFARSFVMMMRSGVPLEKSVVIVANTVGNDYVRKQVLTMRESIDKGESLSVAAQRCGLFSPLALQMIAVGEEAGTIDDMLEQVAEYYEQEVDYDLSRVGDLIEPIMILLMAGLVLFLALSVFLPIWDMVSFAKTG